MPLDPVEIARHLSCPEDSTPLAAVSGGLRCVRCQRIFPFQKPNLLEILPSTPVEISTSEVPAGYHNAYLQAYSRVWESRDDALPWGASETSSAKTVRGRERHTEEVLRLLRDASDDAPSDAGEVFCDFSASAGHTTFAAARHSRLVFHCDLSATAAHYASAKATQLRLDNMMILRSDYFRPPFLKSIHRLTCLDSLIRGPWHDVRLLANIRKALAPGGSAVVDFHNWWHNPLRRVGLLPQNFGENRSYTKREVLQLLRQAGIGEFVIHPFVQEADPQRFAANALQRLMPATRFLVRMQSQFVNHPAAAAAHIQLL